MDRELPSGSPETPQGPSGHPGYGVGPCRPWVQRLPTGGFWGAEPKPNLNVFFLQHPIAGCRAETGLGRRQGDGIVTSVGHEKSHLMIVDVSARHTSGPPPWENPMHSGHHDHHRQPSKGTSCVAASATGYALRQSRNAAFSSCLSRFLHLNVARQEGCESVVSQGVV